MALTGRTVIGVFDEAGNADAAIEALRNAGFSDADIHHSGRGTASTGGFFAGLKNFFTGDDTATTGGHVADDLTNMGVSNDEAQYYDNEYTNGRTIVSVNAGSRAEEAKAILDSHGAYNYATRRGTTATTGYTNTTNTATDTAYAAGTTGAAYTNTTNTDTAAYDRTRDANYANETDQERVIRLREEQLRVSKQPVQAGEVDLRKEVVSQQQTVNVPVTHEEVYIEQRPVTDATADNTPIGTDESIRVPVTDERVNVSKDTVVTGEVSIGKRAVQETQQVTDTVRREELRGAETGDVRVVGDDANIMNTDTTRNTDTRNSI